jgi:RNA polymerase sigma-70 factor, ECF subfamily
MALAQPDRLLLERLRRGEERAFCELMQTYQMPVLAYVHRMVGDMTLAEDLVQDVFLRVYRRVESFRGQCLFTTWLFQIAKNRVLDELRAQARRPNTAAELSDAMVAPDHAPDLDTELDETVAAIWRAVGELEVELKMPLLLRDVAGLSYREIGETLEIELATVKWRIYRARESIQAALAGRQLAPDFARSSSLTRPVLEAQTTPSPV